jgi:uncharacterized protein (DUF427 family)
MKGMPSSTGDHRDAPRVEPTDRRVRVLFGGQTIVDSRRATRVLEGDHPPVYYVPIEDVAPGSLDPSGGRTTFCPWKGTASYFDVVAGGKRAEHAAWTYNEPRPGVETIKDAVAFYAGPMDACYIDDERVEPQAGGFYGGWITSDSQVPRDAVQAERF